MGDKRRKYNKEFKKESVEFLLRSGKTASKVAAELGIRQDLLSRWKREYEEHEDKAFPGQGNPIEAELAQLRKELADVKMERDILKSSIHFQQGPEMIYKFMQDHSESYPVVKMAKTLGIRRNRYYKWINSSVKRQHQLSNERVLIEKIKEIQDQRRFSYGAPRITDDLQESGSPINHKKVARLLRENGLNHRMKKKFRITTDSKHNYMVSPNLLNRDFSATAPNQKWVSDITYIWTAEGWIYLCVIIDLYSRKVIGWSVSSRIDANLLLMAFWHAVQLRNPSKGLIFHSDRGSQYCSKRFRNALKSKKMLQSMSRKGDCWDNACAESFFKSIKTEWLYDEIFISRQEAKNVLFEYIEVFYNRQRKHSYLGFKTPEGYESKSVA